MDRRAFLNLMTAGTGLPALARSSTAQHKSSKRLPRQKPILWVVPYPAGGRSDIKARTVASRMRYHLKQEFLVENRPGAATNIAAKLVALSKPDGYTIMTADNSLLFYNEHLFNTLPFSPADDFCFIGTLGRFSLALVLLKHLPHQSYEAFAAHVKATPTH